MKTSLFFSLIFSLISPVALATGIGDGKNPGAVISLEATEKENAVSKSEVVKVPAENTEKISIDDSDLRDQPVIQETDSSYYSVNKFNILFYFIYKVNFLEKNEEPVIQKATK